MTIFIISGYGRFHNDDIHNNNNNNYRKAENVTFAYGDRSSLHDAQLRRAFRL
jgi:hypothetical protein